MKHNSQKESLEEEVESLEDKKEGKELNYYEKNSITMKIQMQREERRRNKGWILESQGVLAQS